MTFHWTKRLFSNIQQHIKNYSCIKKKVKCMRWQATNTNVSFTVILPTHFKNTWSHNYVAHDSNRKWLFPQTFRKLCWTQTHTWHQTALHTENMCECFTYLCRTWLPVSQSSSLFKKTPCWLPQALFTPLINVHPQLQEHEGTSSSRISPYIFFMFAKTRCQSPARVLVGNPAPHSSVD